MMITLGLQLSLGLLRPVGLHGHVHAPACAVRVPSVVMQERRRVEAKPGDWTCTECGAGPCFASRRECFRCGAPRPEGVGWDSPSRGRRDQDWDRPRGRRDQDWDRPSRGRRDQDDRPSRGQRDRGGRSQEDFQNTRVFIENLSYDTDWKSLKDAFLSENYPVAYASVSTDRDTGRSKGVGIVQFETAHAAEHAIEYMTGAHTRARAQRPRAVLHSRRKLAELC